MLQKRFFGVALDIGTADIKGSLLDIVSKRELAVGSVPNEQKAFGQDVITRLHFATKRGGLKELNKRTIAAVNKLIKQLTRAAAIDECSISKIIAVGNSAMYHLVLMIKPDSLARAPFLPLEKASQERNAREMGIEVGKDAVFRFLPNISGFVGSDILADILETELHLSERYNLLIDIGTNSEIALGRKNKIFVTSCASGPAFEGRHIRCGMPAVDGAIVRAQIMKGKLSFSTVGNIEPKGISGSGLIDIISVLLDKGIIDRKGRMKSGEFVIHKKHGKRIFLTQKDVRELQLAKAAISSGIRILARRAKIGLEDVHRFYITGAFGEGIDKRNARNIGLIPEEVSLDKVTFLKGGALAGARKVLLEPSWEKEADSIAVKCNPVELHKDKDFEDIFADSMSF